MKKVIIVTDNLTYIFVLMVVSVTEAFIAIFPGAGAKTQICSITCPRLHNF